MKILTINFLFIVQIINILVLYSSFLFEIGIKIVWYKDLLRIKKGVRKVKAGGGLSDLGFYLRVLYYKEFSIAK